MFASDKPEDVAKFVLMFLPGFVVLGGVSHFTDQTQSEFAFVYSSVALSMAIYFVSSALAKRQWGSKRRRAAPDDGPANARAEPTATAASGGAFFAIVCLVSTVAFAAITAAVDGEFVLRVARFIGVKVEKQSARGLLPFYFSSDHRGRAASLDKRPTSMWSLCGKDPNKCRKYPYDIYVRVATDEAVFEGRVERYTMDAESNGLPFILSPACRVTTASGAAFGAASAASGAIASPPVETMTMVPGPGVVIFSEGLRYIELKEMCSSTCFLQLNSTECRRPPPRP